jgi:hypothetical protein
MKYLHLAESYILYELPFARGLQYQHAIINMEGGACYYIATPEELASNIQMYESILTSNIDEDLIG